VQPYYERGGIAIYCGECLDVMAEMDAASVDTVITDPPYGLKFMGKDWDRGVPGVAFWEAALKVAKPGAMLLAFGGTRTHHRLMCAIEDAGWEIRDVVMWIYASGFPKSHDISKAIDKAAGAEREIVGNDVARYRRDNDANNTYAAHCGQTGDITAPATDAARTWDGWGTALKPAWEPIILAMKPPDGTFAANALEHGVAGLWVDGGRVETNGENPTAKRRDYGFTPNMEKAADSEARGALRDRSDPIKKAMPNPSDRLGRWPANVIHDGSDEVVGLFPGLGNAGAYTGRNRQGHSKNAIYGAREADTKDIGYADSGSASRFFYCAKASRAERNAGLEGLDSTEQVYYNETIPLNEREVSTWENLGLSQSIQAEGDIQQKRGIIVSAFGILPPKVADLCLLMCMNGRRPMGRFLKALLYTTSTATNKTTASKICSLLHSWNTSESTAGVSCAMASGGSLATSAENSSQSPQITGTSPKKDGLSTDDAESATSESSLIKSVLERLEQECNRIPGHPTVKPLALMRYLCRLTRTPTGGIVLDPFMGSGSTLVAAFQEGRQAIGIDTVEEYCEIAAQRIPKQLVLRLDQ